MIRISPDLETAMLTQAEKTYPYECCGFLLGSLENDGQRTVAEVLPMTNSREQAKQRRRFRIEADDFALAEKQAAEKGLDIIGFYHSHPDHPALPSQYDLEHALPFYSYVIVSVNNGTAENLNSFELALDRSKFNQEL
ncbi:MAG: M67 family metallopeptidase [Deltaproteobacteria bacterium]|jgi:proteasome lid subunit RPN8/RPN11|nr:M67 family metallopeptidase [Deltaproteobacteria bacterium]